MTPIREYRSAPERAHNATTEKWGWAWQSRKSFNLKFVATAEPRSEFTAVMMAGDHTETIIEVAYVTFVNDWMAVMEGEP